MKKISIKKCLKVMLCQFIEFIIPYNESQLVYDTETGYKDLSSKDKKLVLFLWITIIILLILIILIIIK